MAEIKLDRCPCCQSGEGEFRYGEQVRDGSIVHHVCVRCNACGLSTRRVSYPATDPHSELAEQKAANLWNRRSKRR